MPPVVLGFDRDSMVLVGENVIKYTKKKKTVEPIESNGCLTESEEEDKQKMLSDLQSNIDMEEGNNES